MAFSTHGNITTTIREFGANVTVADSLVAHLKYYVDTVCSLLDITEESVVIQEIRQRQPMPTLAHLRHFSSTQRTSADEVKALIFICMIFSPDELIGTVFIQDDDLCGAANSKFIALSRLERNMAISDSGVIAGQTQVVKKIMAFKPFWIVEFWIAPMRCLLPDGDLVNQKILKVRQMVPSIIFLEPLVTFNKQPAYRPLNSTCCRIV